jgi:hypothetical protein
MSPISRRTMLRHHRLPLNDAKAPNVKSLPILHHRRRRRRRRRRLASVLSNNQLSCAPLSPSPSVLYIHRIINNNF